MNKTSMDKVAAQIPTMVTEARDHLRKMAHSLVTEREKRSAVERELRLHKIARRLEERRIDDELSFEQKLNKLASLKSKKLDTFETALELSPGGFKLGALQENDSNNNAGGEDGQGSQARSDLDAWIASGAAYG